MTALTVGAWSLGATMDDIRPLLADGTGPMPRLSNQMALRTHSPGPSPVIFPDQRLPLRFSHVQHLTLADYDRLECTTCHDMAVESRSALDNLIPGEDTCTTCHDIDRRKPAKEVPTGDPPAQCNVCHVGFAIDTDTGLRTVPRVFIPTPNIKFDHRAHVKDLGLTCVQCHGDMVSARVGLATRDHLPRMRTCLDCHDGRTVAVQRGQTGQTAQATAVKAATGTKTPAAKPERRTADKQCITCHIADAGGVVRTDYPSGKLAPSGTLFGADHDMLFRVRHAHAAQNNSDYCSSCHKKNFCVDCHDGVVKPMDFHGNDYVALHAIEARRGSPDCQACHRQQTFCTGCHARSGVSSDVRSGSEFSSADPASRFHPPGWVEFGTRGANHHSFQAQRNIKQCAACHREQFCIGCHGNTVDTLRVNPHPAGWALSRRCRTLFARNKRMCRRCHTNDDEARCM